jgi:glucose/arabinose dehydrogenase
MKARYLIAVLLIAAGLISLYYVLTIRPIQSPGSLEGISLPPGFSISVFADLGSATLSLPGPSTGPRMMLVKGGVLFVSMPSQGRIITLRDSDADKKADNITVFIEGLDRPHGIDFSQGYFYIAEEGRAIRVRDDDNDLIADAGSMEELVELPSGGGHFTRTIKVKDGQMYISIGSSCNVCHEQDTWRASVIRCDVNGSDCGIFAEGLRNSVGLAFRPGTGELYATDNGRDFLGEDLPPDEINLLQEGNDYGWPICYGKNIHDTDFDKNTYVRNPCMEPFETGSLVDLQAHSAPLGLVFYDGSMFPEEYEGKLFVAYHGSWNRQVPTGYKVVTVDPDSEEVSDFATGWLQNSSVLGRPVDVVVADDGALFVSDDAGGKIYRISYSKG